MQRPADYYLIIILSIFLWFNAFCSLSSSSSRLWHTWAIHVSIKAALSLNAPAKIFVIVVSDLLFPFVLHRSVCKGKACFTLTTWLGHLWVWPPLPPPPSPLLVTKRVNVFMNINVSELVPRWQIADRGRWLISCFCAMSIYGVKYIILAMVYIDISDRWITNICVTFTFWFSKR